MKKAVCLLLLLICHQAFSQKREKMNLEEIILQAMDSSKNETLVIQNKKITVSKYFDWNQFTNSAGQVVLNRSLRIENCLFPETQIHQLVADSLIFNNTQVYGFSADLWFYNCNIKWLVFDGGSIRGIYVGPYDVYKNSTVRYLGIYHTDSLEKVTLRKASIQEFIVSTEWQSEITINESAIERIHLGYNDTGSATYRLEINESMVGSPISKTFSLDPFASPALVLNEGFTSVELNNSIVEGDMHLRHFRVEEQLIVRMSKISGKIRFEKTALGPTKTNIKFQQFGSKKIVSDRSVLEFDSLLGVYRPTYFSINSDSLVHKGLYDTVMVSNMDSSYFNTAGDFDDLVTIYQNLYFGYKERGDLMSANLCYAEMKDLQTSYYRYQYKQDKKFASFFRWKLATLMKVYTEHGTDPARAIVVSIWVVLLFGVFYFFFPSDWDITSKSNLIRDYKIFIEKNDKGYIRPFLTLLVGFVVSLINAFTLSLNSFTTLGFGNIPTHGIAKYFCVLEGFIGWFLLSIFTVALINQVLG